MAATSIVRDFVIGDKPKLLELAFATGLFTEEELDQLLCETLDGISSGSLGPVHKALVFDLPDGSGPAGWTYCAPSEEDGLELFWIGVNPKMHSSGFGKELLRDVERRVETEGHMRLVICTSSSSATDKAKAFYERNGYQREEAVVPDYYGPGESKLTFFKIFP
jgi:ribosomal protein S18 acetylase RimI-like enzyme